MKVNFMIFIKHFAEQFDKMINIYAPVRANEMFSVHSRRSNLDVSRKSATFAAILQN